MVTKLSSAIQGIYTPHPTPSPFDIDLACLVQSIGGPRLLFALNRALGLPSYTNLMRQQKVPVLVPSVSIPAFLEVNENIGHFFCEEQQPTTAICGHSLLIDDVAIEEKARYLRSNDSILGVWQEHGSTLDLHLRSQEILNDIEDALHNDKLRAHYASEATVVAIAPFRNSSYSAILVALSGSCKVETGEGMALWLCQGRPRWSPEIQSTLVWSSCWGATGSAGRSTQRGEQRVVRARGNKGEVGVTRDQCRVW